MRNKFGYYILLSFVLCFSFMGSVFAQMSVVTENGKNEVVEGGEISVLLKLEDEEAISFCLIESVTEDDIEIKEYFVLNNWVIDSAGTNKFSLENGNEDYKVMGNNIFKIKLIIFYS